MTVTAVENYPQNTQSYISTVRSSHLNVSRENQHYLRSYLPQGISKKYFIVIWVNQPLD